MIPFLRKLQWLRERPRKEQELQDELQFHLQEETEAREHSGVPSPQARLAARKELGNFVLVEENTRAAWGWKLLEEFAQDCRYGLRMMVANRTFSALAILSLALGIGANTAIYSFMDSILLRSLPVSHPESLVLLNWHNSLQLRNTVFHSMSGNVWDDPKTGAVGPIFPYPAFEMFQKSSAVFSDVFGYYPTRRRNLMVKGEAEAALGEYVTGDYFRGLGVRPAAGRVLLPGDDRVGAPPVAVLSYGCARSRFGDAAAAPGQSIRINDISFAVVGVAAEGFHGIDPTFEPDFYIPLHANLIGQEESPEIYLDGNYYWLEAMARLRPGVSMQQAQTALGPAFRDWAASTATKADERAHLPTLLLRRGGGGADGVRYTYSKPLWVLLALAMSILTIACANIANLLLARATARRREMAVRLSIGAGRGRIIRQLLTESLVLASAGGALGVLLAIWGIRALTLLANSSDAATINAELNWHVMAVAAVLALVTGILFGLAPALQSTRVDLITALKQTWSAQPVARHWFRGGGLSRLLVVGQIGMSLLLLVAAGLFVRTLANLQSIDLGFQRENLLLFQMNARQAGHKDPEILRFYSDLLAEFRRVPGVVQASVTHYPLIGKGTWMGGVTPVGVERRGITTHILMTGDDFFATLKIPVIAGRALDARDSAGAPPVAVVNEAYAKAYFEGRSAVGQHIVIQRRKPLPFREVEIVGVARNARYGQIEGAFKPILYVPFTQGSYYPVDEMSFVLRTVGDPMRFAGSVREIVRRADPRIPVTDIETEAAQIDGTISRPILFARLCTAFAVLALLIACVGLYGTMTYTVARRTSEIGIRMALGAQRGMVIWMVLREVLLLAAVGLAIGIRTAMATTKLVESFLFEIKPNDPLALWGAGAILLAAAVLAGYLPASKASRIDPVGALREE